MLKIDRSNKRFTPLDAPSLADISITERYGLQELISNSPGAFFKELGQELFLLGKEVEPSKTVQDRIDLLAVDKKGLCVVVELKLANHKLHLLQAISYAGMIAQWQADDLLGLLNSEQRESLEDFLEVEIEEINRQQRLILIAEAFDYAVLIGAEWLSERHGVGIACCRVSVAKDPVTCSEYLVCSNVYPAPELAQQAVPRGRMLAGDATAKWSDWGGALQSITNSALVSYYRQELDQNRESNLGKRNLIYRLGGKRRWFLGARSSKGYVWQRQRFEGDVQYWQRRLSKPNEVEPVKDAECLRFYLHTGDDIRLFHEAVTQELQPVEWLDGSLDDEPEDAEPKESNGSGGVV